MFFILLGSSHLLLFPSSRVLLLRFLSVSVYFSFSGIDLTRSSAHEFSAYITNIHSGSFACHSFLMWQLEVKFLSIARIFSVNWPGKNEWQFSHFIYLIELLCLLRLFSIYFLFSISISFSFLFNDLRINFCFFIAIN